MAVGDVTFTDHGTFDALSGATTALKTAIDAISFKTIGEASGGRIFLIPTGQGGQVELYSMAVALA